MIQIPAPGNSGSGDFFVDNFITKTAYKTVMEYIYIE